MKHEYVFLVSLLFIFAVFLTPLGGTSKISKLTDNLVGQSVFYDDIVNKSRKIGSDSPELPEEPSTPSDDDENFTVNNQSETIIKILGIVVNHENSRTMIEQDLEKANDILFGEVKSVKTYFEEMSLGRIEINGDVVGPLVIDPYGDLCDDKEWVLDSIEKAKEAYGINTDDYDRIIVFWPETDVCYFTGRAITPNLISIDKFDENFDYMVAVVVHEVAHYAPSGTLLNHAYALYGTVSINDEMALLSPDKPLSLYSAGEYNKGDPFDMLGAGRHHLNAFHKYQWDLINESQIERVVLGSRPFSKQYKLYPYSSDEGKVMVSIDLNNFKPGFTDSLRGGMAFLETRVPLGQFDDFDKDSPITNGVTFSFIEDLGNGPGTYIIDTHPDTETFIDCPILPGENFALFNDTLIISIEKVDESIYFVVNITFNEFEKNEDGGFCINGIYCKSELCILPYCRSTYCPLSTSLRTHGCRTVNKEGNAVYGICSAEVGQKYNHCSSEEISLIYNKDAGVYYYFDSCNQTGIDMEGKACMTKPEFLRDRFFSPGVCKGGDCKEELYVLNATLSSGTEKNINSILYGDNFTFSWDTFDAIRRCSVTPSNSTSRLYVRSEGFKDEIKVNGSSGEIEFSAILPELVDSNNITFNVICTMDALENLDEEVSLNLEFVSNCADTDSNSEYPKGDNYYVKGKRKYEGDVCLDTDQWEEDYCIASPLLDSSGNIISDPDKEVISCSGPDCYLIEYHCTEDCNDRFVGYQCPYSCVDGQCVSMKGDKIRIIH